MTLSYGSDLSAGEARNEDCGTTGSLTGVAPEGRDGHRERAQDPDHSEGEQRFLVLGMSAASRFWVVSYAERPPRTRIISARLATGPERRKYEED